VKLLAMAAAAFVAVLVFMVMAIGAAVGQGQPSASGAPTSVKGIPPAYLALYVQAAQETGIDWAILAAIGSVETDHGRLQGGACAVSGAGARGPMQFMPGTWLLYGKGGDVCDPVDAIPAAARLLVASGAPKDYHRAIFAYNHAEWYVKEVTDKAREYRAAANVPAPPQDGQSGPLSGTWLMPVPGTGAQCDARIVPNVLMILHQFHAQLGDCYSATGHESSGEHPLGLAVDLTPAPPASWGAMAALARYAGWRPACASSGCAGQTHTAFRFVGWNGYPGHGDPAHAGNNAHLHLSWDHGSGRPASWVRLIAG
jgi:hypothetical protein